VTYALGTAKEAFDLILSVGAGTGLIYLLRWFWWRVSAWSEMAAMVSSFVVALGFFIARKNGVEIETTSALLITVAVTTIVWLVTTMLAPATDRATLVKFYSLVRPAGPGWTAIRAESGLPASNDSLPQALAGWTLGCVFVYAALFGTGSLLYGRMAQFYVWLAVVVLSGLGLWRVMRAFFAAGPTAG
jgi:SSS family solute:Na+ symporter